MSEQTVVKGSGWSVLSAAALYCIGVASGAALGLVAGLVIAIAGDGLSYFLLIGLVSGAVGAAVGCVAGLGSLAALLITDRWGNRSPRFRMAAGATGATLSVAVVATLVALQGEWVFGAVTLSLIAIVSVAAGGAAALILGLFEHRMRRRSARS